MYGKHDRQQVKKMLIYYYKLDNETFWSVASYKAVKTLILILKHMHKLNPII